MHLSALTFGTLLSSQESDAHRSLALQPGSRGNLRYFTGPDPPSQDPVLADPPPASRQPVRVRRRVPAALAFGGFGATGRFRVPRLAPTRRTLRGSQVAGQIGSRWAESQACNLPPATQMWGWGP